MGQRWGYREMGRWKMGISPISSGDGKMGRWGYRAELLHAAEEEKRVGWSVAVRYLSPRLRYGKAKEVAQMKGCQPKQVIKSLISRDLHARGLKTLCSIHTSGRRADKTVGKMQPGMSQMSQCRLPAVRHEV